MHNINVYYILLEERMWQNLHWMHAFLTLIDSTVQCSIIRWRGSSSLIVSKTLNSSHLSAANIWIVKNKTYFLVAKFNRYMLCTSYTDETSENFKSFLPNWNYWMFAAFCVFCFIGSFCCCSCTCMLTHCKHHIASCTNWSASLDYNLAFDFFVPLFGCLFIFLPLECSQRSLRQWVAHFKVLLTQNQRLLL